MVIREFNSEIEFKNNGQLSLFFLGTGNAFSKKLFNNNLLIVKGEDHVLVDIGTLTPLSFSTFNTDIGKIKNLLITHAHSDHVGGVEELALSAMYLYNEKINLIIEDSFKKNLWNNTLKGGLGLRGEEKMRQKLTLDDYFVQIKPKNIKGAPRPFMNVNIGELNLKLFRTKHEFLEKNNWDTGMYSLGVLIDERVLFTADTKFDRPLIKWLTTDYNIEHIFHDCSFNISAVHACYEELKSLPSELKSRTTLCHYSDTTAGFDVTTDGFAGMAKRGVYYDFAPLAYN